MSWFTRRPDPVLEMAKVFAQVLEQTVSAQQKVIETVTQSSENATRAALASAEALHAHLDLFKVSDAPEPRIIRDADEYQMELDRLQAGAQAAEPQRASLERLNETLDIEALSAEIGL